jgi:hypothetical protein
MEGCEKVGGPWSLLPLNEVPEEPGDLWPGDVESSEWRSVPGLKLSEADCGLDDKRSDFFEQDDDDGHLGEDRCAGKASDFGFGEDTEILLGRGVGPLGSGSKGLELLMSVGPPYDLGNEPGVFLDRHVAREPMVVDPVGAVPGMGHKPWIGGFHALPATGEGRSF